MSVEFSIKTPIFVLSQIYEKNEPRGSLATYELRSSNIERYLSCGCH